MLNLYKLEEPVCKMLEIAGIELRFEYFKIIAILGGRVEKEHIINTVYTKNTLSFLTAYEYEWLEKIKLGMLFNYDTDIHCYTGKVETNPVVNHDNWIIFEASITERNDI